MKCFLIFQIFTTILFISVVNGKIPDYIQVCKANDPQITKCIENSILNLRDKLVEGIPELEVPPIDPLRSEKLTLNLGPGFNAVGRNLILTGARNFKMHDLLADVKANTFTFAVTFPEVQATGTYEIDAKIAAIPLKGSGPIHLVGRSVTGRGTMRGKKVIRGGKAYQWYSSMSMKLEIGDYEIKLENLFEGDPTIGEVTNKLLNDEKTEVLASMLPVLEKALIEHFLLIANNVCKHFTWDELFPES